jgi:hypothetical protein
VPDRHLIPALLVVALSLPLGLGLGGCGSGSAETTAQPPTDAPAAPAAGGSPQGSRHAGGGVAKQQKGQVQSSEQAQAAAPKEPAHFTPPPHDDSGGGVAQFEVKAGDNSIQEAGKEASGAAFAEAAATLHAFLDARAARAWAVACQQMSPVVVSELGSTGGKSTCAAALSRLSAGVPEVALRQAAVADVGALRADGDHGFILFRGAGGRSFFMPMTREGGHWKVASVTASLLQ